MNASKFSLSDRNVLLDLVLAGHLYKLPNLCLNRIVLMTSTQITTIIFDLGGVLIDRNPRYLYRKIFDTEEQIDWFLQNICTEEWQARQDAGKEFEEANAELFSLFPEHRAAIEASYARWNETVGGHLNETVKILYALKKSGRYKIYSLTNWSSEGFRWIRRKFEFLSWFDGIVVSGTEKVQKPDPAIYHILFNRYRVDPQTAIFIDYNKANIAAAQKLGLQTIHFQNPAMLRADLIRMGLLFPAVL